MSSFLGTLGDTASVCQLSKLAHIALLIDPSYICNPETTHTVVSQVFSSAFFLILLVIFRSLEWFRIISSPF